MGLIKKISEEIALRKEEKAVIRKMAQERLNKKREFDKMLDMRLPCENIIKLSTNNGELEEYDYYLMSTVPLVVLVLMQEGIKNIPCKFKGLTGFFAGIVYSDRFNPKRGDGCVHMYLNPLDRSKLTVSINGYIRNDEIEQHFGELTELEKQYGETISIRQLLLLWKKDNGIEETINFESDYDMIKRLYDSEDILDKPKTEELSK